MLDGILLRYAIGGKELLIADEGRIGLEGIDLGDVALQEDLQLASVDQQGIIPDDGIQEAFILLVTTQLRLPVIRPGDEDGLQGQGVVQHIHVRIETELPLAVHHPGRDGDPEAELHRPVAFGHILKPRRNHSRVDDVRSNHFTFFVPHCFHDDHVVL